jgi:Uma2 family endonuclease
MFGARVARDLDDEECRIPDVFVTCEPMPEHVFFGARVVVEILSPSTEKEDRTTKLDFYKSLPTVEAILLVWQDRRRVELHTREGQRWPAQDLVAGSAAPLPGLGVELPLDEIYAGVEFPPAPSRAGA